MSGESFLGPDLSDLLFSVFEFRVNLPSWQIQQLPSHHAKKFVGVNYVDGLVQGSCQAVSLVLGCNVRLVYKSNDIVDILELA